jgi:predicted HTH domain antitoxin
MLFTAVSPLAKLALHADFSEEEFQALLRKREKELNTYFEKGAVFTPAPPR